MDLVELPSEAIMAVWEDQADLLSVATVEEVDFLDHSDHLLEVTVEVEDHLRAAITVLIGRRFKFVAARIATQQIIDIRLQFRYLGARVATTTYLFGDNASVVQSASIPHSRLAKRHIALSYHCVREAIAAGLIKFGHIPGDENVADILSKHWGYSKIWPMLQPLLFYEGNTIHTLYKTKWKGTPKTGSAVRSRINAHALGIYADTVYGSNYPPDHAAPSSPQPKPSG